MKKYIAAVALCLFSSVLFSGETKEEFRKKLESMSYKLSTITGYQYATVEQTTQHLNRVSAMMADIRLLNIEGYKKGFISASSAGSNIGHQYSTMAELLNQIDDFETANDLADHALRFLEGSSSEPNIIIDKGFYTHRHNPEKAREILKAYHLKPGFLTGTMEKQRNDSQVLKFLTGLNEEYGYTDEAYENYQQHFEWILTFPFIERQEVQEMVSLYQKFLDEVGMPADEYSKLIPDDFPERSRISEAHRLESDRADSEAFAANFEAMFVDQ